MSRRRERLEKVGELERLARKLGTLEVMEMIARGAYQRTKNPYWKEQAEWIKKQRAREIELAEMMLPLS